MRPSGAPAPGAEGYRITTAANGEAPAVVISGADSRGLLFGVGKLLRSMRFSAGAAILSASLELVSTPRYGLRGHQLGYRPKTNSYDGWTVAMWEQYIRDLAVFGTNAIELIPPRSDDAADSPHFPIPQIDMMVEMSRIVDEFGLDVWIWYPALDENYADPEMVEFALEEWGEVLQRLPRVDAVFVPGGDPGHTQPKHLLALLEKQKASLRRYHPDAEMWVSPQSFNAEWLEEFFGLLNAEPEWLDGVVFGPQTRIGLPELRRRTPVRYPIRRYPDITHSRQSQYPVPDWDVAFALTEGREIINPRPTDQARIFEIYREHAIGFLAYSEGCNDDVNKFVWSALGWDPDADLFEALREYSRYFIGPNFEDAFAHGLLGLEQNWRGPLAVNAGVESTLHRFQAMERRASPGQLLNWRFQMALYRAYYDAYLRTRLLHETGLETQALSVLADAASSGSLPAIRAARAALDQARLQPAGAHLRRRVLELAEALFQSARMQLSVDKYQAIGAERGANLDNLDAALSNGPWLLANLRRIEALPAEADRLAEIQALLGYEDPGPGGFYDDLGDPTRQPHVVRGPGFQDDPAFLTSAMTGFSVRGLVREHPLAQARKSWWRQTESLNDHPLRMRYDGLDPAASYRLRVVYGGDTLEPKIRLETEGREVHGPIERPVPFRPLEFEIPGEATADGELELTWRREDGLGGSGRGMQVSEVWLLKK